MYPNRRGAQPLHETGVWMCDPSPLPPDTDHRIDRTDNTIINPAPRNELVKSCLRLLCSAQDVKIFF